MKSQQMIKFIASIMVMTIFSTTEANFQYKIVTSTSTIRNSDTDDPVYISLIGTKGDVRERRIDNEADNFERGRNDTFILIAPQDLGEINEIVLRKTGSDGWNCNSVVVTGKSGSFTFDIRRWFDNENGHQLSYRFVNIYKMKSFYFDTDASVPIGKTPEVLGEITVTNNCQEEHLERCSDQSQSLTISKTRTYEKHYSYTAGFEISIGTSVEVGLPGVGSASVSTTITTSFSHTWGKAVQESRTWSGSYPCVARPGSTVHCVFYVNRLTVDVPFVIEWANGKTTRGIYEGVYYINSGFNATTTFH